MILSMASSSSLPPGLLSVLNGESQDFTVKAKKAYPMQSAIGMILFGLFWLGFISIFWIVFLGPVFQGQEVHFKANGLPVTAGPGHLQALWGPGAFIGFFTLIGIFILGGGIRALITPGPWFVGTPTRLIVWSPHILRTIDWEQFDGSMDVAGGDIEGTITLEMRTGVMVSRRNGPEQYVPDKIYIVGIPNAVGIEEMCRKRIKENDKNAAHLGKNFSRLP